jgi:hypothetical protein
MNEYITILIIVGIISTFVMPFLLINAYRQLSVDYDFEFNEDNTVKYYYVSLIGWVIFYIILVITFVVFKDSPNERRKCKHDTTTHIQPTDSLDIIIKERAKNKFNNTIFAGIEFGDSKENVTKKLKKYKQNFGNVIYADSSSYHFNIIELGYYKDKLHTLTISLGSIWTDKKDLWELYRLKYGETQYNDWEWLDVIIDYSEQTASTQVWDTKGYNGKKYYHNGDYKSITTTPEYFSVIKYQSKAILAEKEKDKIREYEKEKMREDSIRKAKILEEKKRAKEISKNSIIPI